MPTSPTMTTRPRRGKPSGPAAPDRRCCRGRHDHRVADRGVGGQIASSSSRTYAAWPAPPARYRDHLRVLVDAHDLAARRPARAARRAGRRARARSRHAFPQAGHRPGRTRAGRCCRRAKRRGANSTPSGIRAQRLPARGPPPRARRSRARTRNRVAGDQPLTRAPTSRTTPAAEYRAAPADRVASGPRRQSRRSVAANLSSTWRT